MKRVARVLGGLEGILFAIVLLGWVICALHLGYRYAVIGGCAVGMLYAGAVVLGKRRRWASVLSGLLALAILIPPGIAIVMYEGSFVRGKPASESFVPSTIRTVDSPFTSCRGLELSGRFYLPEDGEGRAVVIFAHGIGGSHRGYTSTIRTLTGHGFLVYAYDATAHGESGGRTCHGLPQGMLDLERAIGHVRGSGMAEGKPLVLMGHSWGAYSSCAVLNKVPDVDAVVALAGFDDPTDMIRLTLRERMGRAGELMLPFLYGWQRLRFLGLGWEAGMTASEGLAKTRAPVLLVQSRDDRTVPPALGYDRYAERFGGDPRFTFLEYVGRGHSNLFDGIVLGEVLDFLDGALGV